MNLRKNIYTRIRILKRNENELLMSRHSIKMSVISNLYEVAALGISFLLFVNLSNQTILLLQWILVKRY